jgi:hypothetical protein
MTTACTFPVLPLKEICDRFQEVVEFEIPEKCLRDPVDAIFVRKIYETIFSRIPFLEENVAQNDIKQMFGDAQKEICFIENLRSLLVASGMNDFSPVSDVYQPTSARVIRVLSAISNFILYLDNVAHPLHDTYGNTGSLSNDLAKANAELEILKEEVLKEENDIANEKGEAEQLVRQRDELKKNVLELNGQHQKLKTESEHLKNVLRQIITENEQKEEDIKKQKKKIW